MIIKPKFFTIIILFVVACSSNNTIITGSYRMPADSSVINYERVFVAALTTNTAVRHSVENSISQQLNNKGIAAVKSIDVLAPDFREKENSKNKQLIIDKVNQNRCDAILTVGIMKEDSETRYVPGTVYGGAPYFSPFGAYYAYGYNSFYSPGYYTTDKIFYLETNLYDAKTEKLVWSAQSKTYNPSSIENFLKDYEKALSERMKKDGIFSNALK